MPKVIRIEDQNTLIETSSYPYAKWPFDHFNPVQSRLIEIYDKPNSVSIAARTSAGKTISAEMYMAFELAKRGGKSLYIGPLRALTNEKKDDWSAPTHHFHDKQVSICTGDFRITESRIKELDKADIIVMTPEMLASRCRNSKSEKSRFLKQIGTVVFDESHLLTVPGRGDHIEVALMKITEINPDIRVVLLSATMPNVDEITGWVSELTEKDAYYLNSQYRPVPLVMHYETYYDGDKTYDAKEQEKVATAMGIVTYYTDDKFLIFVHTKRTGQAMVDALKTYGIKSQFHNANMDFKDRIELESKFRNDPNFRVIVATSTLAWGMNLPARRVIITGVDRGMQTVENYDINQMIGRAGRKGLDPKGDAYVLVPESKKKETIAKLQENPPIRSQLLEEVGGKYKTLAFHVVSEIHHKDITTKAEFHRWFRRSLAFHQTNKLRDDIIDSTIDSLLKCRAIVLDGEQYEVTPVGIVASMFYYSPFDVSDLRRNFQKLFDRQRETDDYFVAAALGDIDSNRFGIVNKAEKLEMSRFATKIKSTCGEESLTDSAIKAAFCYHNLMNGHEVPAFVAYQATLRQDSERTMEVVSALDGMAGKWGKSRFLSTLRLRLTYGVRAELVPLCGIPNIGKARAERLWKANVKTVEDFSKCAHNRLSLIMGISEDMAKRSLDAARHIVINEASSGGGWS